MKLMTMMALVMGWSTLPSQGLSIAERSALFRGEACRSGEAVYAVGEEWEDISVGALLTCLPDPSTGRAQSLLVACRLPDGRRLGPGGVLRSIPDDAVYRCNAEAGLLETLRGMGGAALLCREEAETPAEMVARKDAVRAANAAFLKSATTPEDLREYLRHFRDGRLETYEGIQANAYYQALLSLRPVDYQAKPVCYALACDGGLCHAGNDGLPSFHHACERSHRCNGLFRRLVDTQRLQRTEEELRRRRL